MTELTTNTQTLLLNDGHRIPQVGFGAMRVPKEGILDALNAGYRLLDTATIYKNEQDVGDAIRQSGIPREQLFVVTKLWNTDHKRVEAALDESLKKLGLEYVDLYLIHWPWSEIEGTDHEVYTDWTFVDTYKALQKVYKTTGKIRSLGVSNFTIAQLEQLSSDKDIDVVPAVNQIEAHPLLTQPKLMAYLESKNILAQAYSPLGGSGNFLFKYKEVTDMASRYGVTPAQLLISWGVQRRTVVIPRSATRSRIESNIRTFTLKDADFEALNTLSDTYGVIRNNDTWRFTPGEE
ncbi:Glycerol 2-dehydrogenase (NADP(+)) [Yamadazyma tenuis]|uniref:2-dehydropantolactone reductase n=1 Tax=Candida tenuis (strain ATCC 10573 / BCRC 21748 / CBS 615 / JCM 9827 / NBRC 10315 / NRRL Y-1498 / VKM Y-70) TaxID=590646 RepID=G3B075_CANTC|nr:GCY protein [Yamadazyma tenuis ATCC 10573]EGV65337.1 GCY protein [Yamadazyma tenuis ATCC 10573]WEJ95007.1 Glycerol 2-dehydrogenase (NADP(+)) [Yamadazyma tenuis]